MPLSEHEQRLLDQIERALYAEDPKFASTVRSTDLRTHMRRRLRRASVVLVLGFVLLVGGAVTQRIAVGVIGFVVMLCALLLALSAWKRLSGAPAPLRVVTDEPSGGGGGGGGSRRLPKPGRNRPSGGSGGFRDRLEERWNRRWDERGERGER